LFIFFANNVRSLPSAIKQELKDIKLCAHDQNENFPNIIYHIMLFCSAFFSAMSDGNRDLFMEELLNGLSLIRLHNEGFNLQIISREGSIHRAHLVVIASFSPAFRQNLVPQFVIYEWL
jgi:hypothetical protein